MHTGSFSLNLIKVLTMALIIAFIIFAAFADKSAGGLKSDIVSLFDKSNDSGGYFSSNDVKWHTPKILDNASPDMRIIRNSRKWLPTPPPG